MALLDCTIKTATNVFPLYRGNRDLFTRGIDTLKIHSLVKAFPGSQDSDKNKVMVYPE
jgi:hypothetical protein